MKLIQKYIIAVSVVVALISGIYLSSSKSDEVKPSVSQSGIEGITPKEVKPVSQLGNKRENNPLGSGKIDPIQAVEITDPSPNIPQPNTLWSTKTRQINGKLVTYEFGKGNPPEVALTGQALKDYWRKNSKGYMTPQAELALKAFLDNPSLPYFINKCYKQVNWYHRGENLNEWSKFPQNLSIENIMYIDPETGRKEFKYDEIVTIAGTFNGMDNLLEEVESKRTWNECLSKTEYTQHFLPLVEQFFWVWKYYGNQWETR